MLKKSYLLVFALAVYLASAIFNNGFYHFDEHYQIIEFAELKAGNNCISDLAWEYKSSIRSSFQPAIVNVLFDVLRKVDVTDPYYLAMCLRIMMALFSVVIITFFIEVSKHLVDKHLHIFYAILSYFLWFLPFINVRFSSESCSGLTFLLSIAFFYSDKRYRYWAVGGLLAISFLCRYQTAFMSIGLIFWLVIIHKIGFKNFMRLTTAGILTLIGGFLIDFWFYGRATFPFINYYRANVVEGVASGYGVSPWYFYFEQVSWSAIVPIGIIVLICFFVQVFFEKKSLLAWVMVPFLVIHCIIPHKELRFLFPLANLVPLVIIKSTQRLKNALSGIHIKTIKWTVRTLVFILVIFNIVALSLAVFSPADEEGRMNITEAIHRRYKGQETVLWIVNYDNPYRPIPVNQNFYRNKNVEVRGVFDDAPLRLSRSRKNLLVMRTDDIEEHNFLADFCTIKTIAFGIPKWIRSIKEMAGYKSHSLILIEISPLLSANEGQ